MKIRLLLVLTSFAVPQASKRVAGESPPVKIQIVEDEDEDFFDHGPPKKKPAKQEPKEDPAPSPPAEDKKPESTPKPGSGPGDDGLDLGITPGANAVPAGGGVRKNAEEAFDDLERMERAHGKPVPEKRASPSTGAGALAPPAPTVDPKSARRAIGDPRIAPPSRSPPPGAMNDPYATTAAKPDSATTARTSPRDHDRWSGWWDRSNRLQTGDVMFLYSLGTHPGGAYHGLGFEGLFSDRAGLKLTVHADYFDRSHSDRDLSSTQLGFFTRHRDAGSDAPRLERAFQHKEELSVTIHARSHGSIDLYTAFGFSHVGYDLRSGDLNERGGSAYLRAGIGLNWFFRRFFIGADLGWYPLEIFRYAIERTGPRNTDEVRWKDVSSPYDAGRLTFAGHTGLSF